MQDQTLKFLLQRFQEAGITPRHQLGQNFLMDLNLQRLLIRRAEIQPTDIVLEVGTGTGGVTVSLVKSALHVVTVELDPQLYQLASEELFGCENVTMLHEDILKNKNRLNPKVLEEIQRLLEKHPESEWKLVANLPYNVATPIMTNLLALEKPPKSMTVTIQKEVGDRMVASPGTKDYGSLSLWVQCQADVEIVRVLPPSVFLPRPKVFSAIVHLERNLEKRNRVKDLERFHTFIRAMFFHRRKFLRSELLSAFKGQLTKPQVDTILESQGLSAQMRAEELDLEQMLRLCEACYASVSAQS